MYDILIRDGRIVDGTGAPWFRADLGIVGERIVTLGVLHDCEGRVVISAEGRVVAPGFVDFHSHSDAALLADPRAQSAVRQGITTQLVGNCGFSAAPVPAKDRAAFKRDGLMFSHAGYDWDWTSMAEFRQRLQRAGPAINVLSLVGHNTLRAAVMGQVDRPASEPELQQMRRLLEHALEEGAVGLSSGLTYSPGCYASTVELEQLAAVLGGSGMGYHTHLRNYGAGLGEAIGEALRITAAARVPLFISHLYPAGREHWGTAPRVLGLLEAARGRGAEVCYDVTPWLRGGGPLHQYLPGWARAGGTSATLARLDDRRERAAIAREMEEGVSGLHPDWTDELIVRVGAPEHSEWVGQTVAELAAARGEQATETALKLLADDDGQVWVAPTSKYGPDVDVLLSHSLGIPVTDGITVALDGPLGRPEMQKSFGTFPRVLGHYVRDRGVLSLESAIRKMSAEPARRLGVWDRGLLRPGMAADVTVFDPAGVGDAGDERHGGRYPRGIDHVIVNGQLTVTPTGYTGAAAGRVI
jgi:N-acyl-D-amino-acid deacylase